MKIIRKLASLIPFAFILAVGALHALAEPALPDHFNTPATNLVTGGQPTQAELATLKNAGVTKIINLRGPNETIPYNEEAEAQSLGMEYVALPIKDASDITVANAEKLHQHLQGDDKVFVHCATSNRVGALLAIRAHEIEGKPPEASLDFGRAAGLGSLEDRVKSVLE